MSALDVDIDEEILSGAIPKDDYSDARSALIVVANLLVELGGTDDFEQQAILLHRAFDACCGALHYVGCDDVIFDMFDGAKIE